VSGLSDQFYRNAWSVLGGVLGGRGGRSRSHCNSGYHDPGFFFRWVTLAVCSALFLKVGTTIMLGI